MSIHDQERWSDLLGRSAAAELHRLRLRDLTLERIEITGRPEAARLAAEQRERLVERMRRLRVQMTMHNPRRRT